MPPALSPQAAPGSAQRGEGRGRLCPSIAGTGGDFCPIGVIPHWCDRTLPPQPEGPGSSEGHQRGCGIISPLALPRYSAVTGHAVAPSQPRCAVPDEELRGTAASDNLRSTAAAGSPPPPRASRSAGTPIMGHPSCQLVTGVLPTALPRWHIPLRARGSLCRHPGTATHPWARPRIPGAATNTALATEEGTRASPRLRPRNPRQGPAPRPPPRPGGSVPVLQPGHRIRATVVTEGPCRSVMRRGQGCQGSFPTAVTVIPPRRSRQPRSSHGQAGGGLDPPASPGTGAGLGEGGQWCSPGPPARPPGAGLGLPQPLSRSASPSIPQLVALRVPVMCPHPPRPGHGVPGGI